MIPAYRPTSRQDRLHPPWWHPRFAVLTLLADGLRRVVESELVPGEVTVLDYGCGEKPYALLFCDKAGRYLAADLPGNPCADVHVGPDGRLPLEADSIDCVLSAQVLEHVADPAAYLGEASRVLKAGGVLILSTHGIWPYHPDPADYRRWTRPGLIHEITRVGFQVVHSEGVLGLGATGLQLQQDAMARRAPRWMWAACVPFFQCLIYLLGRNPRNRNCQDACVYIVVARKSGAGSGRAL